MTFALLTTAELRLIDVLLERGVFPNPPVSVIRLDRVTTAPAGTKLRNFPHLRDRIPGIMAISRPVGDVLAHGSLAELLNLLARPPIRAPTDD